MCFRHDGLEKRHEHYLTPTVSGFQGRDRPSYQCSSRFAGYVNTHPPRFQVRARPSYIKSIAHLCSIPQQRKRHLWQDSTAVNRVLRIGTNYTHKQTRSISIYHVYLSRERHTCTRGKGQGLVPSHTYHDCYCSQ